MEYGARHFGEAELHEYLCFLEDFDIEYVLRILRYPPNKRKPFSVMAYPKNEAERLSITRFLHER